MREYKLILSFIFICSLFGYMVACSYEWLRKVCYIPISKVSFVGGSQFTPQEQLKEIVSDMLKPGFFEIKVNEVHKRLLDLPWIESAKVQKVWPGKINIKLQEHKPLAKWRHGIIDTSGKLFFPDDFAAVKDIPEFSGDEQQISHLIDTYLLMEKLLQPSGLTVNKLEIMPDHGWRAMLNNKVVIILGRIELERRFKRFITSIESKITYDLRRVDYVDLRYVNGAAIGWKF